MRLSNLDIKLHIQYFLLFIVDIKDSDVVKEVSEFSNIDSQQILF